MQLSTDATTGGGDLSLSYQRVAAKAHNANADFVAASCAEQLLYSLSTAATDGDAAFGSSGALGNCATWKLQWCRGEWDAARHCVP